jgi:hypothetical protein
MRGNRIVLLTALLLAVVLPALFTMPMVKAQAPLNGTMWLQYETAAVAGSGSNTLFVPGFRAQMFAIYGLQSGAAKTIVVTIYDPPNSGPATASDSSTITLTCSAVMMSPVRYYYIAGSDTMRIASGANIDYGGVDVFAR